MMTSSEREQLARVPLVELVPKIRALLARRCRTLGDRAKPGTVTAPPDGLDGDVFMAVPAVDGER